MRIVSLSQSDQYCRNKATVFVRVTVQKSKKHSVCSYPYHISLLHMTFVAMQTYFPVLISVSSEDKGRWILINGLVPGGLLFHLFWAKMSVTFGPAIKLIDKSQIPILWPSPCQVLFKLDFLRMPSIGTVFIYLHTWADQLRFCSLCGIHSNSYPRCHGKAVCTCVGQLHIHSHLEFRTTKCFLVNFKTKPVIYMYLPNINSQLADLILIKI